MRHPNPEEYRRVMEENVERGLMKRVSDGKYAITPAGEAHVAAMHRSVPGICGKCGGLCAYDVGRESLCPRCHTLKAIIDYLDGLQRWRATVDVVSGTKAADELADLLDQGKALAEEARRL